MKDEGRAARAAILTRGPRSNQQRPGALGALPPHPSRPYDVVLAWNVLDILGERERALLIDRLDELTVTGARLYVAIDDSGRSARSRVRHTLSRLDRLREEVLGPPGPGGSRLLRAQVERLLMPFEVVQAFTLRQGVREYVGVKGGAAAYRRGSSRRS